MRTEWIEGRLNKRSPLTQLEKDNIAEAYYQTFKKEMLGHCENCYFDALFEIYLTQKNMSNYKLKNGVAFRYDKIIYTHINLTDEAAEWFLNQDAGNRKLFHKIAKQVSEKKQPKTKK